MRDSNSVTETHPVFSKYFSSLPDPRRTNKGHLLYPFEEILFLTISAVLSGCNDWTSITLFGRTKLDWLRNFLPYQKGIPSHDVLGKVFAALDPVQFNLCFTQWISSLSGLITGEVVAIDGKRICGSGDKGAQKAALHVVSAYAAGNRICLGQRAVDDKSNEITAIPELLNLVDIKGCTVTIDAMGCQKSIAGAIIEKEADYILMVKDNQKGLKEQLEKVFSSTTGASVEHTLDMGHGRIEHRDCLVTDRISFLDGREEWTGLKTIAKIISRRILKQTGKESTET